MTPVMAPEGARCGTHQGRPAVDTCTRCGAFVCGECGELFQDSLYCSACFALVRPQVASRRSRWALRLGLAALLVPVLLLLLQATIAGPIAGLALGVSAAVTARLELLAITRQEAPQGGRRRTVAGLVMGFVAALLWLALMVLAMVVVSSISEHD